jgi:hypothetical protein
VLKDIKYYYEVMEPADPKLAELPESSSIAIEMLDVQNG